MLDNPILDCRFRLAIGFGEMLIESDDGLDAFVEMVEAVVFVWRVDGIFAKAEAHQDGLDAQNLFECGDDWNAAA